jgi:nucleoid-associated protein YgaU
MRNDLKTGIFVGIGLVFVGWAVFALLSETPQQRRQNQFANEPLQTPKKQPPIQAPRTAPLQESAPKPVLVPVEVKTIHVVVQGETLSSIAVQYFGTSAAWQKIMDANTDILQSPGQLRPGMRLKIPAE